MIYREARPPRLGLAFSKDSTAHLPRDTAFLQDSASRPMYPPNFSRIPPRACRAMPHFSNIRPRTRCTPRIFREFHHAPAARLNISLRFRFAPDVSPVFLQDSTTRPVRGPIFLQDSTAHPTRAPYFSKIRPRTRREVPHFSKIRPRTRRGRDIWEIFNPRISGSSPIPIGTQPSHPSIPRA